ncbi:hypothetical protein K227x_45180 [Rubripirellula lacrimiformis]|uniref:HicB family protein n=1 Tax=Rubripirellula lacrimiformis TaxID=1930273 RepID=A0A517NG66_9BACT|nr:hypothetical protein [Rubripirellula lacrimiformis]QDT06111.1 hypothetical protein K227x_45180 [Rubripirellula lacrimiformis]
MASTEHSTPLRYASDAKPGSPNPATGSTSGDRAMPVSRLDLHQPRPGLPAEQRGRAVMDIAEQAFAKTGNWVVFYREILGKDGVVHQSFPDAAEYADFQKGPQYAELQEMVAALRSQDVSKGDSSEPERMITIRLPKSLHDALTEESNDLNLSINKLCISKLLQRIESRFVPVQQGRRRGRRPGPQGPRKKPASDQPSENS